MRARNIKPGFWANEELAGVGLLARLTFIGLWNMADRNGVLEDRPLRIKGELFRFDAVTAADVDGALNELAKSGLIRRYESNGQHAIWVVKFREHQTPHFKERGCGIEPPKETSMKSQENRAGPNLAPTQPPLNHESGIMNHESTLSECSGSDEPESDSGNFELLPVEPPPPKEKKPKPPPKPHAAEAQALAIGWRENLKSAGVSDCTSTKEQRGALGRMARKAHEGKTSVERLLELHRWSISQPNKYLRQPTPLGFERRLADIELERGVVSPVQQSLEQALAMLSPKQREWYEAGYTLEVVTRPGFDPARGGIRAEWIRPEAYRQ